MWCEGSFVNSGEFFQFYMEFWYKLVLMLELLTYHECYMLRWGPDQLPGKNKIHIVANSKMSATQQPCSWESF